MSEAEALYPLLLEPIYKEKVWGGRRFERLGRTLPGSRDTPWGESWEVADLSSTAPSGGGGEAARSVIENGPLAGSSLTDLMTERRAELLGPARPSAEGGFPLLVKYLDARHGLSVQVHPSPEYAARHPDARLKSEAWYVADAAPGACIYKGLAEGTTRAELERAIRDGTVPDLMVVVPAVPGETHYLPSGICHALGAAVLVAEVQTPSDTTFRVYDWGRTDREIHIEQALDATIYDASGPPVTSATSGQGEHELVRCEHFWIDEWSLEAGDRRAAEPIGPEVWMVMSGAITVEPAESAFSPVPVRGGRTVLLPASLGAVVAVADEPTRLLRVRVPVQ